MINYTFRFLDMMNASIFFTAAKKKPEEREKKKKTAKCYDNAYERCIVNIHIYCRAISMFTFTVIRNIYNLLFKFATHLSYYKP